MNLPRPVLAGCLAGTAAAGLAYATPPSHLFSIGTPALVVFVAVTALLGWGLDTTTWPRVGLLTGVALATNPLALHHAHDTITLTWLGTTVALLLLLEHLERSTPLRHWTYNIAVAIALAAQPASCFVLLLLAFWYGIIAAASPRDDRPRQLGWVLTFPLIATTAYILINPSITALDSDLGDTTVGSALVEWMRLSFQNVWMLTPFFGLSLLLAILGMAARRNKPTQPVMIEISLIIIILVGAWLWLSFVGSPDPRILTPLLPIWLTAFALPLARALGTIHREHPRAERLVTYLAVVGLIGAAAYRL